MGNLLSDIRYAVRSLRQAAGFTIVAVGTLALGIGAVTALFTVLDGVLLKPLRYPDPALIVSVANRYSDRGTGIQALTGGDEMDISREPNVFAAFARSATAMMT